MGVPQAVTVRFTPLSVPVTDGELLTTLILYFEPALEVVVITAFMFPELAVLLSVPMFTGVENDPLLFES